MYLIELEQTDVAKREGITIEEYIIKNKVDFDNKKSQRNNYLQSQVDGTKNYQNYIDISSLIQTQYSEYNQHVYSVIIRNAQGKDFLTFSRDLQTKNDLTIDYSLTDNILSTNKETKDNFDTFKEKLKKITNSIENINVIFILHIQDNNLPEFIQSTNYDNTLKNIYFYLHKTKKNRKKTDKIYEIKMRFILHLEKDSLDDSYSIDVAHMPIVTEETTGATEDGVEVEEAEEKPSSPVAEKEEEEEEPSSSEILSTGKKNKTKYTYNPDDIYASLEKYKIVNTSDPADSMQGEYLLGNEYGLNKEYQNLYKQIDTTQKYTLSGVVESMRSSLQTKKITWLRLER